MRGGDPVRFGLDLTTHGVCMAWISKSRYNADLRGGIALHKIPYGGATRGCTMRVRMKSSRLVSMPVPNLSMRHW
jgi:hypothetical protein